MEKVKQLEKTIIKRTIILIGILMIAGLLIFRDATIAIGLVFGSAISVLNFLELSKTLKSAVKKSPSQASTFATIKYLFRFAVTGITLYVAATTEHINFLATVIGLLSMKLVIYQTSFFSDRLFFKKIMRKEDKV